MMGKPLRELLQTAAHKLHELKDPNFMNYEVLTDCVLLELGCTRGAITSYWKPLQDDGEALRLAVDLCLLIQVRKRVTIVTDIDGKTLSSVMHTKDLDKYTATRIAILKAAGDDSL